MALWLLLIPFGATLAAGWWLAFLVHDFWCPRHETEERAEVYQLLRKRTDARSDHPSFYDWDA